jgi:transcriptional regulator with XRE-family HTH domain
MNPNRDEVLAGASEDVKRVREALRQALRSRGTTLGEASSYLGRYPEYLSRALSGRVDLKIHDLFTLLQLMGLHPEDFFDIYFPVAGSATLGLRELASPEEDRARGIARRLLHEGLQGRDRSISCEEWVSRTGSLLREFLRRHNVTQKELSVRLGLSGTMLGQRLRGDSRLLTWQLFAVLRLLGVDPGRFFVELVHQDEPLTERLRLSQTLDLWEQQHRDLAEQSLARRKVRLAKEAREGKPG